MQYKIGKYKFQTREEYEAGRRDAEKIMSFPKEEESDYATALSYTIYMKQEQMVFESVIGREFTREIRKKLYKGKRRRRLRKTGKRLVTAFTVLCVVTAVWSAGFFIWDYIREWQDNKSYEEILAMAGEGRRREPDRRLRESRGEPADGKEGSVSFLDSPWEPVALNQYQELYQGNPDFAGWLKIDGTVIDYPVMWQGEGDYYLTHNYQQENAKNGSIILDERCSLTDSSHSMLYGHNMQSGKMFGGLEKYGNKEYYEKHRLIQYDTVYESGLYEVMAVFRSRIYYQDEEVFKFYEYPVLLEEEKYNEYVAGVKELSLFDTGVWAEYGDRLLTLVTCEYSDEDGRFVVVAREVR